MKRDRYVTAKCPKCGRFMTKRKQIVFGRREHEVGWVCENPKCTKYDRRKA